MAAGCKIRTLEKETLMLIMVIRILFIAQMFKCFYRDEVEVFKLLPSWLEWIIPGAYYYGLFQHSAGNNYSFYDITGYLQICIVMIHSVGISHSDESEDKDSTPRKRVVRP